MNDLANGKTHLVSRSRIQKDLGIWIQNDLKWHSQVCSAASKGNRILGQVLHGIKFRTQTVIKLLYTSLVRPHLEYAIPVWCPYLEKDKRILEAVQRRATRAISGFRDLNYNDRQKALNLTNLTERRMRGDLIQMFKAKRNIDHVKWQSPLTFSSRSTRGHPNKIKREIIKNCAQRYHFFTNRVVNGWNKLEVDAVEAQSCDIFKAKIDKNRHNIFCT